MNRLTLLGAGAAVGGSVADATITTNFLARTSGLDATHTNAYKVLINGLVTDGICTDTTWGPFDLLYILATQDSTTALLNLPSATYNATPTNSPTFSADNGYAGNGTTSYLDTNFKPTTAPSPHFVQDDGHISVWNLTNQQTVNGSLGNFSTNNVIHCRFTDDNVYMRLNSSTGATGQSNADARGFYHISRTSSSSVDWYKNGSAIGTYSDTSGTLAAHNFYVCGQNINGGVVSVTNQIAMASFGSKLTSAQELAFYNRLRTYMTTVGVP